MDSVEPDRHCACCRSRRQPDEDDGGLNQRWPAHLATVRMPKFHVRRANLFVPTQIANVHSSPSGKTSLDFSRALQGRTSQVSPTFALDGWHVPVAVEGKTGGHGADGETEAYGDVDLPYKRKQTVLDEANPHSMGHAASPQLPQSPYHLRHMARRPICY